jgi:hypothetical protein
MLLIYSRNFIKISVIDIGIILLCIMGAPLAFLRVNVCVPLSILVFLKGMLNMMSRKAAENAHIVFGSTIVLSRIDNVSPAVEASAVEMLFNMI